MKPPTRLSGLFFSEEEHLHGVHSGQNGTVLGTERDRQIDESREAAATSSRDIISTWDRRHVIKSMGERRFIQ